MPNNRHQENSSAARRGELNLKPHTMFWRATVVLVCFQGILSESARSQPIGQEITPAHVFAKVELLQARLEAIRFEMGRPANTQPEIDVTNVAPREVFFQALTLFRKADRLCFEQTRERAPVPEIPAKDIRPFHVFSAVNAALARIDRIREAIATSGETIAPERDDSKTPTDVFQSIVQTNRQLNLLLDDKVSPGDVFQQVTLAVSYTSRLLAQFPEANRIPDSPQYERGKRPADVYRRLVGCFERTRRIAAQGGLETLDLKLTDSSIDSVVPSDVYDIASLLVSELAYIHSHVPNAAPPIEVYHPGQKYPSHVYQRAGILERQLTELQEQVERIPGQLFGGV